MASQHTRLNQNKMLQNGIPSLLDQKVGNRGYEGILGVAPKNGAIPRNNVHGNCPVPTNDIKPHRRGGRRGNDRSGDSRSKSCGPRRQMNNSRACISSNIGKDQQVYDQERGNRQQQPGSKIRASTSDLSSIANKDRHQLSSKIRASTTDLSSIVDKDVLHNLIAEKVADALLKQTKELKLLSNKNKATGNHGNKSVDLDGAVAAVANNSRSKKLGKHVDLNDCHFFFAEGGCKKGVNCPYRHEDSARNTEVVCANWLILKCYDKLCPHRHTDLKNERCNLQCPHRSTPGGCKHEKCVFLHSIPSIQSTVVVEVPVARLVDI